MKRGVLGLTACQEEALRLRCQGLQNKEIAERMFLSEHSIRSRMVMVYRTLGLEGGAQGAAACYRLGIEEERQRWLVRLRQVDA